MREETLRSKAATISSGVFAALKADSDLPVSLQSASCKNFSRYAGFAAKISSTLITTSLGRTPIESPLATSTS